MIFIGVALILLLAELFTGTFYLIVLCLAFAIGGIGQLAFGLSWNVVLVMVGVLSVLGVGLIYGYHVSKSKAIAPVFDDDYDVGQEVVLQQFLGGDLWNVAYRGVNWQAKLEELLPEDALLGRRAVITSKLGNMLIIRLA